MLVLAEINLFQVEKEDFGRLYLRHIGLCDFVASVFMLTLFKQGFRNFRGEMVENLLASIRLKPNCSHVGR